MATDIKQAATESLQKSIAEMRETLRVFRFEGAGSRTRNVRAGRMLRRDIARTLTELRSRDLSDKGVIAPEEKKA